MIVMLAMDISSTMMRTIQMAIIGLNVKYVNADSMMIVLWATKQSVKNP